jgi:hypothetical protein
VLATWRREVSLKLRSLYSRGKSSRYSLTGMIDEEKHSVLARTQAPVPELTLLTL